MSTCAMMLEQWVSEASNATRKTPSVGSATVGTGVQSWEVNASSQPFTPTAKLRVRPAAAAPAARTAAASASAASADERNRQGFIISDILDLLCKGGVILGVTR